MEDLFLKLKHNIIILSLFAFSFNSFAIDVIVATSKINYKEKIDSSKLRLSKVNELKKSCKALTLKIYNSDTFIAKHVIKKGSIICLKDIKTSKQESVIFKFGSLQIEKEGKILFENNEYIRIKKNDGKVEKIYKDGTIK